MSNFEVSREIVQELAETGSVQLVGCPELPTANDFFEEERQGALLPSELSEEEAAERANRLAASRAIAASKNLLNSVLYDVYTISLGHSPFVPSDPEITHYPAMSETKEFLDLDCDLNISVLRFHQDRGNSMWGATIIRSVYPVQGEELVVAGRGFRPTRDMLKTYKYADGPILLAQKGFGEVLVGEEGAKNAVWHRGQRTENGYLGLTDANFRAPLLRRQAIKYATYKFKSSWRASPIN